MAAKKSESEVKPKIQEIIDLSIFAKSNAYCPYSKFKVGAAVLCQNGKIYQGCNIENISFGLTVCAERTAVIKAVSEGETQFTAIAICSDNEDKEGNFSASCGACRQFLIEFGDFDVYIVTPDKRWKMYRLTDLLPAHFTPQSVYRDNKL